MKLELRENGTLVHDGIAIGRYDQEEARLVLNLGWMGAAGCKITVEGDPSHDRRRKVLERPLDLVRLEQGDQLSFVGGGTTGKEQATTPPDGDS